MSLSHSADRINSLKRVLYKTSSAQKRKIILKKIEVIEHRIARDKKRAEKCPNVKAPPVFTDHAFLRYMERVLDYDIEAMKEELLTPEILDAMAAQAKSITHDGVTYRIVGNAITTVLRGNHA